MLKKSIFCMISVFIVVSLFPMEKQHNPDGNVQIILSAFVNYFKNSAPSKEYSDAAWHGLSELKSNVDINSYLGYQHVVDICTLLKNVPKVKDLFSLLGIPERTKEVDNRVSLIHFLDRLIPLVLSGGQKEESAEDSLSGDEKGLIRAQQSNFFEQCNKKKNALLEEKDRNRTVLTKCVQKERWEKERFMDKNIDLASEVIRLESEHQRLTSKNNSLEVSMLELESYKQQAESYKQQVESSIKRSSQERNILILAVLFLVAYILKLKLLSTISSNNNYEL